MLILLQREIDPEAPLLTVEDCKLHLHINGDSEDSYLVDLIDIATEYVERETGRSLIPSTWREVLPSFPKRWELQRSPVQAVVSLTYYDSNNELQTLLDEDTDPSPILELGGFNRPTLIYPVPQTEWPSTYARVDAVTVDYDAGYGGSGIPLVARQALLLLIGTWYSTRESEGEVRTQELQSGLTRLLSHLDYRGYA